MKKFLIVVAILIVLIIGVLGFALVNANKLVAQFKPELEQLVSKAIGVKVEFHNIDVTVLPQTALKVSGLTIKNEAGGTVSEPGPAFEEFILKLNLSSLLKGSLAINQISIAAPKFTILKKASGISIKGLPFGQAKSGDQNPAQTPESKPENRESSKTTQLPISIALEGFELKNGTVVFEDQTSSKSYSVTELNVKTALSLAGKNIDTTDLYVTGNLLEKFPFKLSIPKISLRDKDLSIESIDAKLADIAVKLSTSINIATLNGKANLSSDEIDIANILPLASEFVPIINQFGLKGTLAPNFDIKLNGSEPPALVGNVALSKIAASQGIFSVTDLVGNLAITAQSPTKAQASSDNLQLALNGQSINLKFLAKLLDSNLNLENFAVNLLGGSVAGSAHLGLDQNKLFSAKLQGESISIEQTLAIIHAQSANISGSVDSFNTSVNGNLGPDLKESLRGNLIAKLSNGELKGWNLPGLVLKAVNNLPFLTGALYSSVPDSERSSVDSSNTAFKSIDADISFIGSGVNVNSIKLFAPVFSLDANGKMDFDTNLDLNSTIFFNKNFSESLVSRVAQLKNILDDQGQLTMPLKLKGKPPLVLAYPNVQKLLELAGKRILVEKAGDAVRGILEKKGFGGVGGLLGF